MMRIIIKRIENRNTLEKSRNNLKLEKEEI